MRVVDMMLALPSLLLAVSIAEGTFWRYLKMAMLDADAQAGGTAGGAPGEPADSSRQR